MDADQEEAAHLMKPLSPLAHTAGDDSSTLGVRDWLAGARPVAGAATASCLLLVVCSLFAVNAGGLGHRRDVGQPTPVRLQTNATDAGRPAARTPSTVHARANPGAATTRPKHHVARTARDDSVAPSDVHAAVPDTTQAPPTAKPTPSSGPTPTGTTPPPSTPELPTVTVTPPTSVLPPVTVTVPPAPVQLPPVGVPTLTTSVNLP
jgi:hypothetical protein